ncbi:MAG: oligosaccharide repeat unit polymerase [Fibrobacterota bacterium]|nr:oligosaccharide repeat unit polymerase [Fibrobacterota bacterium]
MTWIYLAVLAVAVGSALLRGGDLFSPGRIYIALYSLLMALWSLKLSQLQTPWSMTTHLLFWGANIMFVTGNFLAFMLRTIKVPDFRLDFGRIRSRLAMDAAGMDWPWLYRVFFCCVLVYLISFAASAVITGGIPVLAKRPDEARIAFFGATVITNYGMFFGPMALMLCAEMLVFARMERPLKRKVLLLGGTVLFLYLTLVTRYDIFRFFIFSVALYHYGVKPLQLKHLAMGTIFVMGIFMVAFLVRINSGSLDTFNEMIKVRMPPEFAWASGIYAYIANDFWNLDFAIRKFEDGVDFYPIQYGFGLLRAPLFLLHLDAGLANSFGFDSIMNESVIKLKGFNTIIYVWHFYKDFGAIGVYLLALLFGLGVAVFYQNTILRPTIFRVAMWALILPAVVLSYHAPLWELWFFYMNILLMFVAHRKLSIT